MSTAKGLRSNHPHPQCAVALAIVFAITALLAQSPLAAASGVTPLTTVKQLVAQVLSIVKDKEMAQADKEKNLRQLGAANFDFNEMSRLAMGKSWRSLKVGQRQRFVPVFTSFLEDAYLNKIQNYSSQEIQITRAHVTDKDYSEVNGRIVQQGAQPIGLVFSLKRESGVWKIYDVAVDSVSTLDNYRTQFQRIMRENGFDGLMTRIERRDRELASTLGSPTSLPF
ncbi:MAG: MlaC/ttg2D family ABC transporter substrate-binding protein [Candidatus Binataceae bacterium]